MTITPAICNSFKTEILTGVHDFTASTGNTFNIALYSSDSAALSKSTTVWAAASVPSADPTDTYEVTTTGSGYASGGKALTSATPVLSADTACCDFSNISWTSASFTARGCLIYNTNATPDNEQAVCAINFGSDKTVTTGTFTIEFPAQTAGNAILQIA